jgi:hypothetical protein
MTEPTDDELDDLMHAAMPISAHFLPVQKQKARDFARAVLAKWGTPPVVAGEPVAVKAMGYGGSTGINDYLMSDGTVKAMRPAEVRWATRATPQPTQAQAGAVPLNDTEIDRIADRLWEAGYISCLTPETRRNFARAIEAAHGIKGGQHGAE